MLNRLLSFLDASPVNFLAVEQIRLQLEANRMEKANHEYWGNRIIKNVK